MNCPQCSAEVPESAISCTRCGSAVRSVSFSYLPAGAPPWPTTIPQSAYYMSGSALQTSPPQKAEGVAGEGTAKRRWTARGALLVALLFILTPLVGVGITLGVLAANGEFPAKTVASTNTPVQLQQTPGTGTPQTNPGSGSLQAMSSTASTKLGVSMQFPSDWVEDASADSPYVRFHPQSQKGIVFAIQRLSASASAQISSASDLNQLIFQLNFQNSQDPNVVQHIHNFHTITPAQPQRSIGGVQWDEEDGQYTDEFGILFHATTIAVQHNQIYYNIAFIVPDASYNDVMQKSIQPMFDSFKFLS